VRFSIPVSRKRRARWAAVVLVPAWLAVIAATASPAAGAATAAAVPASRPAAGAAAPGLAFLRAIGGPGSRILARPFAVAVSARGAVWVADAGLNRVAEFTAAGRLVTTFSGTGSGALSAPEGIAVDASNHVWVADTGRDRVVEFTAGGRQLAVIGGPGSGPGQLAWPTAVAVARSGQLYVADLGRNRIAEFSGQGRYRGAIAVIRPRGVALDAAGHVWVSSGVAIASDSADNKISEFAPGGRRLRSFGTTQATYGGLSNPAGITVSPAGWVYVAQPDFGWVTVFRRTGRFLAQVGLQASGAAGRNLSFPQDVTVSPGGRIWVADSGNSRVVEYGPRQATLPPPPSHQVPSWLVWLGIGGAALLTGLGLADARRRRAARPGQVTQPAQVTQPGPQPAQPSSPAAPGGMLAAPVADPAPGEKETARPAAPEEPAAGQPGPDRRHVLAAAAALAGAGLTASALPLQLRKALAATPANLPGAKLTDIQHIVILMQENRSFDHYFGAMRGVRGFADPAAIRLPDGRPVFYQPDPAHRRGYLLPFRYDTRTTSAQATPGLDHSWRSQHRAWAGGKLDGWIAAKGPLAMGYFTGDDIPFHWALAEAFTLCDNYHCSALGPTDPNRLHLMTGMLDPDGQHGGPVLGDGPAFSNRILSWTTYPERLERAGISWQVYQEEDNYDNDTLSWFRQFRSAPAASPLYQRGLVRRPAGTFEADARAGRLPQVSWLLAPAAQSEHPPFLVAAGAEYIAQKLDAIASNPDVWAKTVFIVAYDENDGQFDHVPPPVPPRGTPGEFVRGEPIGLGFRVPATIVSPWTAGGFVCSDVFDHTSLIRLIETRFGVREPNISAWRRRTCGDLTAAFRFSARPAGYPHRNTRLRLAAAEASLLTAQRQVHDNPRPRIPAVNERLPG